MRILIIAIMISVAIWNTAIAQGPGAGGIVHGSVTDRETGSGLALANIEVLDTDKGTITDGKGSFTLQLPPGRYKLRFSMIGYQAIVQDVNIVGGGRVALDIELIPIAFMTQTITVIAPESDAGDAPVNDLTLESDQIQQMPGSFVDIYRSVKTLPGVSSNNGMSSEYSVRGGTFDENLVIVNGTEVFRPFHLKEAENASVSIFNMDLISRADLITGGFTAQYGDKMSSVLDISYREGNRDEFCGRIETSIMHSGLLIEGPSPKGSYLLGLRRSHMQYILALLGEDDNDMHFYDVHGQLTLKASPMNSFRLHFIHSGDDYTFQPLTYHEVFDLDGLSGETTKFDENICDYKNNLIALNHKGILGDKAFLETIASYYDEYEREIELARLDKTRIYEGTDGEPDIFEFSSVDESKYRELKIRTSELKLNLHYNPHPFHEILSGMRFQYIRYGYQDDWQRSSVWGNDYEAYPDTTVYTHQDTSTYHIKRSSFKIAGFVEDNWRITNRLFSNVGLRADYFDFNRDLNISPRLNLSYITSVGLVIRAAWGLYYQSPSYRELEYDYETSENTKAQRGMHYIAGFEYPLDLHMTIKAEAYYKDLDRLITFENRNGRLYYSRRNDASGYTAGVDLFLGLKTDRFSGWIGYGYMQAKEDSLGDLWGYNPRPTDQRHTLSLVANKKIWTGMTLRLKVMYGSGYPYTPSHFVMNDDNLWELVYERRNSGRLPSYQRVDLRLSKDFRVKGYDIATYLEVINLLNHRNVFAYEWSFKNYDWLIEETELLPILPNFGVSFRF